MPQQIVGFVAKHKISSMCSIALVVLISCGLLGGTHYVHDRVYPRTWVGNVRVSRLKKDDATSWLERQVKQVEAFTFIMDGSNPVTAHPSEIGLAYLPDRTLDKVFASQRSSTLGWLQLWRRHYMPSELSIDDQKLEAFVRSAFPISETAATDASLAYDTASKSFAVTPEKDGYGLQMDNIRSELRDAAEKVESGNVRVTTGVVKPHITSDQLTILKPTANSLVGKRVSIQGKLSTTTFSADEIATWVQVKLNDHKQPTVMIDTAKLHDSVSNAASMNGVAPLPRKVVKDLATGKETVTQEGKVGQTTSNTDELVAAIDKALVAGKDYQGSFAYVDVPFQTLTSTIDSRVKYAYTYSVETRGTITADLNEFMSQAAETYDDLRGWRAAGRSFTRVASGGDFTLVLAEASQVPSFSGSCSADYSCRVGRYVVINQTRWLHASDSWNASGGSLRDYRHMVINHETGHWLGFDHRTCPAAGQAAPVMMQQSISLGGCTFNPWPTPAELAAL